MPVSAEVFRKSLSQFCTGVTIVTFEDANGLHGLTVNAFSSLSLEPPLVLFCIDKKTTSHDCLSCCDAFVVNILSDEQKDLAARFANWRLSSAERFAESTYDLTETGLPAFRKNLGHLECLQKDALEGGDHTIIIGQVEKAVCSETRAPLLYFQSQFQALAKQ